MLLFKMSKLRTEKFALPAENRRENIDEVTTKITVCRSSIARRKINTKLVVRPTTVARRNQKSSAIRRHRMLIALENLNLNLKLKLKL